MMLGPASLQHTGTRCKHHVIFVYLATEPAPSGWILNVTFREIDKVQWYAKEESNAT